jgi:hypothetical protein
VASRRIECLFWAIKSFDSESRRNSMIKNKQEGIIFVVKLKTWFEENKNVDSAIKKGFLHFWYIMVAR